MSFLTQLDEEKRQAERRKGEVSREIKTKKHAVRERKRQTVRP